MRDEVFDEESLGPERLRFAQVETSRHCNYRCPYCQIAYAARPQRLMSLTEFRRIIDQLVGLPALEKLYLNGYNEPSLVPEIVEQVRLTTCLAAEVVLLTNGTGLTERKFEELARAHSRLTVDIHLSAVDPSEYRKAHGVSLHPRLLPRLRTLAQRSDLAGVVLRMMVMGTGNDRHRKNCEGVRSFFAGTRMDVGMDVVHDRAGALPPPYHQGFRHERVSGCALGNRPVQWVHITAAGNWVLCCQDYDEDYVFGNVLEQTIEEIAESKKRREVIARAMGRATEPQSSICQRCRYAVVDTSQERF